MESRRRRRRGPPVSLSRCCPTVELGVGWLVSRFAGIVSLFSPSPVILQMGYRMLIIPAYIRSYTFRS